MKGNRGFSFIDRFVVGRSRSLAPENVEITPQPIGLTGSALEQAYRNLMLETQVLADSNERLHERLARMESGLEESPAAKELIRAQRNALAERSHRLREVQYENLNLKREHKKLVKENERLLASLARHMQEVQPSMDREEQGRQELEEMKAALREKTNELARLTDRYYQLEARSGVRVPPGSAAGGRF